jgi:DNA-binding NarL/FixJ family response regulator
MLALASPSIVSGIATRSRVLVIGPSSPDSFAVREALENCRLGGAAVASLLSADDARRHISEDVTAILLDLHGPDALNVAARLREEWPRARVILFHAQPDQLICMEVLAPPAGPERTGAAGPGTAHLSARQLDLLRHLASGLSVKEIAHAMRMSYKSVDSLKYRLMRRLAIRDRVGLTRFAIREGLVTP